MLIARNRKNSLINYFLGKIIAITANTGGRMTEIKKIVILISI